MSKLSSNQVAEFKNLSNWFTSRLWDDIVMVEGLSHSQIVERYDELILKVKAQGWVKWVIDSIVKDNLDIINKIEEMRLNLAS